jgi:hypothetical protein
MQLRQAAFYDTIAGSVRVTDLMPLRVTSRHFGKGATRPLSPRADMPDR